MAHSSGHKNPSPQDGKKHSQNALALARWLESQNKVERVFYPELPSHPQHELARRQIAG